ncbi:MAG: tetratricopeptide repeat protein [Armatimonas sp.]
MRWLNRVPPPPPASAPLATRRAYWQNRIKSNISDREAYLQLGLLEERAGFFKSAQRYLESARAIGLPDSEVSAPLGRVYAQVAMLDEAQTELEKAISLFPQQWEPVANLAGLYLRNGRSSRATVVIKDFIKRADLAKLSGPELDRVGLALLEHGMEADAQRVSEEILRRDPDSVGGLSLGARAAFALHDASKAEQLLDKVLTKIPDETTILYFYGLVLRQQGKYDKALAAWQKAQAANPNAADVYERIGEEYARRKDYKRSAEALEFIALADSSLPSALKTAEAYRAAGNQDQANYWEAVVAGLQGKFELALVKAKLAAASKNPEIKRRGQISIAEAYRGMTKKPEYLAAVLEATKAGTAEDYLLRTRAYEYLSEYDKYIATQNEAIRKFPDREAALRFSLALIYSKIGKREEAESNLKRSIELDPRNVEGMRRLASEYFRTRSIGDHLEQASELARKIVSMTQDEPDDWFLLGQIYAAQNQLPRAIYCFEHTIDLEPGFGPVYLELGRAQARNGNSNASKEMMALYQKYVVAEQPATDSAHSCSPQ